MSTPLFKEYIRYNFRFEMLTISNVEQEQLLESSFHADHAIAVAGFLDRPKATYKKDGPPFVLIVKLVAYPGKRSELIEAVEKYTIDVERNQPNTISFVILKAIESEDTIYIWERYTTADAWKESRNTDAFTSLIGSLDRLTQERSKTEFDEISGFMTKEGGLVA